MAKKNTQKTTTTKTVKTTVKKVNLSSDFGKVVNKGKFAAELSPRVKPKK